jgi:hypothetical protein
VSIRKEYIRILLLMMGAVIHAEEREIRREQKHGINRQRANGLVVAVVTQVVELDMFGFEFVSGVLAGLVYFIQQSPKIVAIFPVGVV